MYLYGYFRSLLTGPKTEPGKTDGLPDSGASFSSVSLPGTNSADNINLPSILLAMLKMNYNPVGVQQTPLRFLKGPKVLNNYQGPTVICLSVYVASNFENRYGR